MFMMMKFKVFLATLRFVSQLGGVASVEYSYEELDNRLIIVACNLRKWQMLF